MLAEGLKEALRRRTFRPKIRSDFMGGLKRRVNGTPTFFINGTRHDAGDEYEELVVAIDSQLATETRRAKRRTLSQAPRRKGEEIAMVIQSLSHQ